MKPCCKKETPCAHRRGGRGPALRRVIFLSFLAAIGLAVMVGAVVLHFGHRRDFDGHISNVRDFGRARIEREWNNPEALQQIATDVESHLHIGVEIEDNERGILHASSECFRTEDAHVVDIDVEHGEVRFYVPDPGPPGRVWLALLAVLCALALLSAFLSRRIAAPIARITETADRVGLGDLDARVGRIPAMTYETTLLAEHVDAMVGKIAEQVRSQQRLLSEVSHELRTPLGHLRILLEMAEDQEGEVDAETFQEMLREVCEMDELVGELLARSRIDVTRRSEWRAVNLHSLAERTLVRLGHDAEIEVDSSLTVVGDETLLSRALTNIVRNADSHGSGVVSIRAALVEGEEEVRIDVLDRGPLAKAKARKPRSGIGLGVRLVEEIAELHHGRFELNIEPSGSTASLWVALRPHTSTSSSIPRVDS